MKQDGGRKNHAAPGLSLPWPNPRGLRVPPPALVFCPVGRKYYVAGWCEDDYTGVTATTRPNFRSLFRLLGGKRRPFLPERLALPGYIRHHGLLSKSFGGRPAPRFITVLSRRMAIRTREMRLLLRYVHRFVRYSSAPIKELSIALADRWIAEYTPGMPEEFREVARLFEGYFYPALAERERVASINYEVNTSIAGFEWLPFRFDGKLAYLEW